MIRFPSRSDHPSCPAGWEITQALSQPETSADVIHHVRDCPACAQLAAELRGVISAAAEMPPVAPLSQAARERISRALSMASDEATPPSATLSSATLSSATLPLDRRRRMRFAWAFAAGLAGVAVVLGGWFTAARHPAIPQVTQRPAESTSLAKVHAFGEARFHRFSEPPDEMVRLESGRVAFEVAHLTSEQRFRVVTRDGEVEVRGTRFETEARDGVLWAVVVTEGKVDVRVGDTVLRLRAGDEWQRQPPLLAVEEPATAEPAVQPERAKPASRASRASKESFDLAWSHLRRREWDGAMRGFAEVATQAHGQALEEDALYWQAVATARAGRARGASQLFEALLQRFPAGARTGAATLALAWLRFDAGERDNARALFERAAQDSSAKVREGADEGLHRLRVR
jgi:TolA-binding protein/DNA-binding phage protein